MSIVLNEKKYAEEILKNGEVGSKPSSTLFLLGKYFRNVMNYDINETYKKLNEFMQNNYPNFNPVLWENIIENISKKSSKYKIREINEVGITKKELNTIALLNDIALEKLVFTMLCHAKLYNISSENNNNWVNTKLSELFKLARVNLKNNNDRMLLLHKLLNTKIKQDESECIQLIATSKKNTNLNIQLMFIDNENDPVLFINDFRELGYEYLLYLGENYCRCNICGILFKQNKNNTYKYCSKHRGYKPIRTKIVKCIDCNKEFEVDARNMTKTRCDECQSFINKEKTRLRVQKYRKKKNM